MKYAQINVETGMCVAVSYLYGEIDAPNMIPLEDDEDVSPLDRLVDGVWVKYIPPEPQPAGPTLEERYAALEQQLAQTNADLAAVLEMILV